LKQLPQKKRLTISVTWESGKDTQEGESSKGL